MSEMLVTNLVGAFFYFVALGTLWTCAVLVGHGWALGVERGKRKAKKEADLKREVASLQKSRDILQRRKATVAAAEALFNAHAEGWRQESLASDARLREDGEG